MKQLMNLIALVALTSACQSQTNQNATTKIVGGPCEGCEAVFEYGNKKLTVTDTLPNFSTTEPKLMLNGTVYKKDGKTPAKNVIVYIYHTDTNGVYPTRLSSSGWGKRHGYLRGWVKTGADGK